MGKRVIKRKIKLVPVLLLILIAFLICSLVKMIVGFKVQNIYITNNKHLTDDYIIRQAELTNYPSYFLSFSFSLKNKLEKNDYIESAKINKSFFGVIEITVDENDVLFYKEYDNKYVL